MNEIDIKDREEQDRATHEKAVARLKAETAMLESLPMKQRAVALELLMHGRDAFQD